MKEKLLNDLKNAMKNQNKDLLNVIRMIKGAIQLEEIKLKRELTDNEVVEVVSKQIKQRNETISEIKNTGREDLIKKTEKEIEILNSYMPEQLSDEEIDEIITKAIDEVKPNSPNDIGKIMGKISPLLKGKADMTLVNKKIKDKLNS